MIVDEYGGNDAGHGRAIAKSKNPFWMAEVNLRLPEMPTQPFAGNKGRSVVSWAACLRANMIACEFGNFINSTRPPTRNRACFGRIYQLNVRLGNTHCRLKGKIQDCEKGLKKKRGVRQQSYLRVIVTASKVYSIPGIIAPA